jgi:hypothetical protein
VLAIIALRIGGTPAQVIFKWAHAKGFVVVTTTVSRTHLDDYLDVIDLRASPFLHSFCIFNSSQVSADVVIRAPTFFFVADLTSEEVEAIDRAGAKGPPEPTSA